MVKTSKQFDQIIDKCSSLFEKKMIDYVNYYWNYVSYYEKYVKTDEQHIIGICFLGEVALLCFFAYICFENYRNYYEQVYGNII